MTIETFEPIVDVIEDSLSVYHECSHVYGTLAAPVPPPEDHLRWSFIPEQTVFRRYASDKGSFSKIVKSGKVKMTPMTVRNERIVNYLGSLDRNSYLYYEWCNCGLRYDLYDLNSSWTEQGDLNYWRSVYPDVEFYKATLDHREAAVERAKLSAYSGVQTTYQAGAELGELALSIEEIANILRAVHHPLNAYREFARSLKGVSGSRRAHLLGKKWLEYRYAIMPLAYSAQDILSLIKNRKRKYKTTRRTVTGTVEDSKEGGAETYFYQVASGSIETYVTCKGVWESAASRTYSQIDLNLFTTAWELLPLSFVVDWFIGVGDYIEALAKSVTGTGNITSCVAVRENYQVDTFLHSHDVQTVHITGSNTTCSAGPRTWDVYRGDIITTDLLLRRVEVNNYHRVLFQPSDLKLSLSPFLDWKRTLDGAALSIRPLQRALRRLL